MVVTARRCALAGPTLVAWLCPRSWMAETRTTLIVSGIAQAVGWLWPVAGGIPPSGEPLRTRIAETGLVGPVVVTHAGPSRSCG